MNQKDQSSPETPSPDRGTKVGRRKLVKALGAGASGVVVSQWSKPIVDSVIVPLHAQASPPPPPPPPPPPGCPTSFQGLYNGPPAPFVIVPNNPTGELQFVQTNVHPLLQLSSRVGGFGATSWLANENYAVVLLRVGSQYLIFFDVSIGQVLVQDVILLPGGAPAPISSIAKYVCVAAPV